MAKGIDSKTRVLINEAVRAGLDAGRIQASGAVKDAFRATEKRLYAYPVIKLKIKDDTERIEEILRLGAPGHSKSIIKFQRTGVRLEPEEIAEALVSDIKAHISHNEQEIETINKALEIIAGDPYERIVNYKYFEEKNDEEIAVLVNCDPRTVRRNKSRLVRRLSIFLYGVTAVK